MTTGNERDRREDGSSAPEEQRPPIAAPAIDLDAVRRTRTDAAIRRCAGWLSTHLDEVATAIAQRMTAEVAAYERSARDEVGRATLHANVERIVRLFVTVLAEQRRLAPVERTRIETIGALRAEEGLPLDLIQEGVHVAINEGWRFLCWALLDVETNQKRAFGAIQEISSLVSHFEFDVQRAIAAGYHRGRDEHVVSEARDRDLLLRGLLEGALDVEEVVGTPLEWLAAEPGLEVALVRSAHPDRRAETVASALGGPDRDGVDGPVAFTAPVPHSALIVRARPDAGAAALETIARQHGAALVMETAAGLPDVPRAYALLRDLLPLLPPRAEPGCSTAESLLHLRLLFAAPRDRLVEYVESALGAVFVAIPDDCAETFVTSVLAYYDSPTVQVQEAARTLGLALSTLKHHLKRVEELTGLDKVADRFRLEMATRVWHYLRQRPAQLGDPKWLRARR